MFQLNPKDLKNMLNERLKRVGTNKRIYKKFVDSCPALKVKFGLSNFIDKTTPLVFESYCVARLTDLLLVNK